MSDPAPFTLERLDVAPLAGRWAVVRMLAATAQAPEVPLTPRLVITRPEATTKHGAFVNAADRRGSQLLWLASFAVPLDVVEHPQAVFALTAAGYPALALPTPGTLVLPLSARTELRLARRFPHLHLGRRATAMATALALSATSLPVTGLAAAQTQSALHVGHNGSSDEVSTNAKAHPLVVAQVALPDKPVVKLASTPSASAPAPTATTPAASGTPTTATPSSPTPTASTTPKQPDKPVKPATLTTPAKPGAHRKHSRPKPSKPATHTTPKPTTPGWQTAPSKSPDSKKGAHQSKPTQERRTSSPRSLLPTGGAPIDTLSSQSPSSTHHAVLAATVPAPVSPAVGSAVSTAISPGPSVSLGSAPPAALLAKIYGDIQGPPAFLVQIYKEAQSRYHVPWQILAAINSIETNYGRDLSVSSAGAEGWMQFMPETWAQWGVDANGDGKKNPYDPRDAIFAAARYLRASGAPQRIREAVFAYNHANWYVEDVMRRAQWIADTAGVPVRGKPGEMIKAMKAKADELIGLPYVWGGGHGGWQLVGGYDCSGFVSTVLHAAGYLGSPQTTDTLPGQPGIAGGPGRYVTIFDRTGSGGHVIIDLNGTFYESGGSAASGGGAGVKKIQPPLDYLVTFNTILHPVGL
jgi:hypothetical protein